MIDNLSQTLRQLKILQLINQQGEVSQERLADNFKVSRRTISRDVANLMEVFPLTSRWNNRQKHYTFMDGHQLPQFTFTLAESMALQLAKQVGQRLSSISYLSAAASSVDQILNLLPDNYRRQLEEAQKVIAFRKEELTLTDQQLEWVALARQAASDYRCLELVYLTTETSQINQRVIQPYVIMPESSTVRLIAYCQLRQDFREFLFNRIKSLTLLEESFQRQSSFDVHRYMLGSQIKDQPVNAILVIKSPLIHWIQQDPPPGLIKQTLLTKDKFSLEVDTEGRKELIYWILKYGQLVEVIEPKSLRADVVSELKETLKKYQT